MSSNKYWLKNSGNEKYFAEQLSRPKESTKYIFKILKKKKLNNLTTLDLACGNGANLMYLKKKFDNKKQCLGLDINKSILKKGSKLNNFDDLDLKYGNIFNLNKNLKNKFQLITSFQNFFGFKDYQKASTEMIKLNSKYIFISSLFWEGLIDFNITLNFLKNDKPNRQVLSSAYYNIYSLKNFLNFYKKNNYKKIFCEKYIIKKNIRNNFKEKMGTYTVKNKGKNIQISGPLLMNWYFIIFKKF
tara:strand:- start:50 stop:781 length:732 start_codon:yes stop_codon:yes gene_type:complete